MDDGQYRRALPELRRLADDRAAEAGPADPQSLQFRYDAAQCLEQLGEPAAALAEYRALLPYYENQYATGTDPARPFEIRRRIGHLLLAVGDHAAARAAAPGTAVRHRADVRAAPPAAGGAAPPARPADAGPRRLSGPDAAVRSGPVRESNDTGHRRGHQYAVDKKVTHTGGTLTIDRNCPGRDRGELRPPVMAD